MGVIIFIGGWWVREWVAEPKKTKGNSFLVVVSISGGVGVEAVGRVVT
jgi:hypothetical protein